jgi:hypothetical protein
MNRHISGTDTRAWLGYGVCKGTLLPLEGGSGS